MILSLLPIHLPSNLSTPPTVPNKVRLHDIQVQGFFLLPPKELTGSNQISMFKDDTLGITSTARCIHNTADIFGLGLDRRSWMLTTQRLQLLQADNRPNLSFYFFDNVRFSFSTVN